MPIRVYIIDEHSAVRMNLVRRLSAAEGILVVGDSGEARVALDELRTLRPDVVLIEVKMKRADGVGVCARAACLDHRLKVVVSTIYADTEEQRRVHKAGAVAYLLKDLDTPRLVERLKALVEGGHGSNGDRTAGGPAEEERPLSIAKEGSCEGPRPWYPRILIPLDGSKLSEQVLPCAVALAAPLGSRIELLDIFDPETGAPADSSTASQRRRAGAGSRDRTPEYLDGIGQCLAGLGLTVSLAAGTGDPASRIIAEAEKEPGTLIAMSSHGLSGITHGLLGSVTDKVFRTTRTPLLIVQAQDNEATSPEAGLNHVLVPLDGSPSAEQSLPHAAALARSLALTTILLRTTDGNGEAEAREYLSQVADTLRRQGMDSVDELVFVGDPADAVVETARRTPGSLVTMTTQGRSSMGGWIMGSVTDRVVRYSHGPVLIVRASG